MTSNKKRKSKCSTRASSSSANVDRFWNEVAEQNYAKLMNMSMSRERGYDMEYPNRLVIAHVVSQHWDDFIKPPSCSDPSQITY